MSRREWWKRNEWQIGVAVRHDPGDPLSGDDPLLDAWLDRVENPLRARQSNGWTFGDLVQMSKEIIFCDDKDDGPSFEFISFVLDLGSAEMNVGPFVRQINITDEEALSTIGQALAYSVPIVPDRPELEPQLLAWERELMSKGFTLPDGDGNPVRLALTRYSNVDWSSPGNARGLDVTAPATPSDFRIVTDALHRELAQRDEAGRLLASLRFAIEELETALEVPGGNERGLQRVLTRHPVLFGPEYRRVEAEFQLGADYRMDFALVRPSGLADLVEIEASTHQLFTKRGDPRAPLVHAEQQVLDWLDWLETYGQVARRDLPELQRPVGYVVIGRDESLSDDDKRRLGRRNAVFSGALTIMTYDGLLARGRTLLSHLDGLAMSVDQS